MDTDAYIVGQGLFFSIMGLLTEVLPVFVLILSLLLLAMRCYLALREIRKGDDDEL